MTRGDYIGWVGTRLQEPQYGKTIEASEANLAEKYILFWNTATPNMKHRVILPIHPKYGIGGYDIKYHTRDSEGRRPNRIVFSSGLWELLHDTREQYTLNSIIAMMLPARNGYPSVYDEYESWQLRQSDNKEI